MIVIYRDLMGMSMRSRSSVKTHGCGCAFLYRWSYIKGGTPLLLTYAYYLPKYIQWSYCPSSVPLLDFCRVMRSPTSPQWYWHCRRTSSLDPLTASTASEKEPLLFHEYTIGPWALLLLLLLLIMQYHLCHGTGPSTTPCVTLNDTLLLNVLGTNLVQWGQKVLIIYLFFFILIKALFLLIPILPSF